MPRKYVREDFRDRAKGLRHTADSTRDPVERARMSPRQARLLLLIGVGAAFGLYIVGQLHGRIQDRPEPRLHHAVGTVIGKGLEQIDAAECRYTLEVEVPLDDTTTATDTVLVPADDWLLIDENSRIGVGYVSTWRHARIDIRRIYLKPNELPPEAP
ncbi:MAG: hypothetical protein JXR94_12330 [Candidatus Hydrogenedentes bacterium]|nr:hypothetical protein [Candidatus Hydrogenedentota bacterium]